MCAECISRVLQEGEIVESGTHAELMEKHGIFADMVGQQQIQHERGETAGLDAIKGMWR